MSKLKNPIFVYGGVNKCGCSECLYNYSFSLTNDAIVKTLGNKYARRFWADEIYKVAVDAETWCDQYGLRIKDRIGMLLVHTCGGKGVHRKVTVCLKRRVRGWYLTAVDADSDGDGPHLYLTAAQDSKVKAYLSKQYSMQKSDTQVAER